MRYSRRFFRIFWGLSEATNLRIHSFQLKKKTSVSNFDTQNPLKNYRKSSDTPANQTLIAQQWKKSNFNFSKNCIATMYCVCFLQSQPSKHKKLHSLLVKVVLYCPFKYRFNCKKLQFIIAHKCGAKLLAFYELMNLDEGLKFFFLIIWKAGGGKNWDIPSRVGFQGDKNFFFGKIIAFWKCHVCGFTVVIYRLNFNFQVSHNNFFLGLKLKCLSFNEKVNGNGFFAW